MENKSSSNMTPQLVMGLVVILLGVLFTLNNLSILRARDFLHYWPVAVIAVGLAKFVQTTTTPGRVGGMVIVIVGTLLLFNNLTVLDFKLRNYWPVILVFIGASMVWQAFSRERGFPVGAESTVNALAVMGGVARACNSQDFRGSERTLLNFLRSTVWLRFSPARSGS